MQVHGLAKCRVTSGDEAGKFVQSQVKSAYCRSGMCAYLL